MGFCDRVAYGLRGALLKKRPDYHLSLNRLEFEFIDGAERIYPRSLEYRSDRVPWKSSDHISGELVQGPHRLTAKKKQEG